MGDFGAPSDKPVFIRSSSEKILNAIVPTAGWTPRPPAQRARLGKRWWDGLAQKWRFNGSKKDMTESSKYPEDFGISFARCLDVFMH